MSGQLASTCPATGQLLWTGPVSTAADVHHAVSRARESFAEWRRTPLDRRIEVARAYAFALARRAESLAELVSCETGKILWETRQEVASMIGKVELSIAAQAERAGERRATVAFGESVLRHRPHGVMAVLGPYNFPGHLPNGHIVPALLAGNTIVFKPSELTPAVGEAMAEVWHEAGLPDGVLNLVYGGRETGASLVQAQIDGLLFTGSASAGMHFRRALADRPEVILALELGGNNPLVVWDGDIAETAALIVQSAYATSGQRCTCARRLILPEGVFGDRIIEAVASLADRLLIGAWNDDPAPYLGPLISERAAETARMQANQLIARGARAIRPLASVAGRSPAFVGPALLDVTGVDTPDEEIFAPVLQVRRAPNFGSAIAAANDTRFGLSAGLCLWTMPCGNASCSKPGPASSTATGRRPGLQVPRRSAGSAIPAIIGQAPSMPPIIAPTRWLASRHRPPAATIARLNTSCTDDRAVPRRRGPGCPSQTGPDKRRSHRGRFQRQ